MMHTFENTFVRGPSPSYSDEAATTSDNAMMAGDGYQSEKHASSPYLTKQRGNGGDVTFAFWTIIAVLLVLTVGNLVLTLTIMGVLHLGKGVRGMELIPEEDCIKFGGITDLDRVYSKVVGQMEGFADVPVTITGDDGNVYVRLLRNGQPHDRLIMGKMGTQFRGINTFEVKDAKDGATIFTTHRPHYNLPRGAESLVAKMLSATRITSPIGKPLHFEADTRISLRGSEGLAMEAANILLQAEHNIALNSTQGSTVLEASGIFLDMDKMPIVSSEFGLRTGSVQYKICVCMPSGVLFRIAIPPSPRVSNGPRITCAHFTSSHDPCGKN